MNKQITWTVDWSVKEGEEKQFLKLAEQFTEETNSNEPNTTEYMWFKSSNTKWKLIESYSDSNAAIHHLGNVGPKLGVFFEISKITGFVVCGTPSNELKEMMKGMCQQMGLELDISEYQLGFTR